MSALFCDLGGCFLTNGWDRKARRLACEKFHFDYAVIEPLHWKIVSDFEKGNLTLGQYLDQTFFAAPAAVPREEFIAFMKSCSESMPRSLDVLADFRRRKPEVHVYTLNNESRELNDDRIVRFDLVRYFDAFFSSCFLGCRKPDREIYGRALELTQSDPARSLMIDDRAENLATAAALGMPTHHFETPEKLREALTRFP